MFQFSKCLWFFDCLSRDLASGTKRILLSAASPSFIQSANKRMTVFSQRVAGGLRSPSCSMPTGLKNVLSATVKKRFARSDESQADRGNSCLIFPEWMSRWQLITWLILRHLCPIFLALPSVLHPTKPAHFTWMIQERERERGSPCHVWPQGNIL